MAGAVLPHGGIEQLEENLWRVEGTLPNMPLKRVMTIVKVDVKVNVDEAMGAMGGDGDRGKRLLIHNPIALQDIALRELEALGTPSYLVIPNGWHRLDSRWFVQRYPQARVYAPAGSRKKVAEHVPVAGTPADFNLLFPADPSVSLTDLDGTAGRELVMTVRSRRGVTVVFADALFNMPHLSGFQGFVLRHITQSSGGPRTSRVARLLIIKDKRAFAAHLERLADPSPPLPVVRIIVAHHLPITDRPAEVLRQVAQSLTS